ncbi:NAD(P)-dependent oxidoreductase [Propionispora hippei]|uniref:3-hydroxyisobutyrate dehydrogenase n=1 Tax=Propionispora hippei DSM 15287 TaxID=1123003 RepID=A0A1M6IZQ3_9FIRM|nr:NAD(P)-dependent oxidoreductase [Propionispora hippei]SHJ39897.1 3-hydroxyisobutyrate dehydrogenase [Propionispora hippei DSM 15287]
MGLPTIGFIGTGVMGKSMAGHLLRSGYSLQVYNRTKAKAQALLDQGAVWAASPGDVAAACDIVITMIGYPKDVEEVYLGDGGLIARAQTGTILIDMTTSSPLLARRLYAAGAEKGVHVLDAPVSGGDVGARDGRLSIMVGGDEAVFQKAAPLFECMGTNIVLQGSAGAGQHTKMCNQIAIASNMMGVCEAMAYAVKAGLDPTRVLTSIATGAAGSFSLSNLAPRMLRGDTAPGFYVKHFIKDMKIAIEAAEEMGLVLPGLLQAKALYEKLAAAGHENSGTQALYLLYSGEQ